MKFGRSVDDERWVVFCLHFKEQFENVILHNNKVISFYKTKALLYRAIVNWKMRRAKRVYNVHF